jgi:ribosomal protein L16 Arg81 hydroxylase
MAKIGDPEKPDEIQEQVLRPGDLLLIPSNVHHDMTALTDLEAWETRGMEGPDGWEEFSVRITPDGD